MMEKKEGIVTQSAKVRILLAVVSLIAMLTLALAACALSGTKAESTGGKSVDWDAIVAENPHDPFVASYT